MPLPIDVRIDAATGAREGAVADSGLASLRLALSNNATGFAEWRRLKMTKAVVGAIQHALVHPPATLAGTDALVQYGVSQGLVFALQVMLDPSVLWPGVFGDQAKETVRMPEMDFEAPLDAALS